MHHGEMLLHDFLDDGEAEPRPARTRRDIGLEQARAIGGQADSAVADRHADNVGIACVDRDIDPACIGALARLDRLDRILDEVGHCLAQLASVAHQFGVRLGDFERKNDQRVGDFVEEHRLAHDIDQRFGPENGLGHARK